MTGLVIMLRVTEQYNRYGLIPMFDLTWELTGITPIQKRKLTQRKRLLLNSIKNGGITYLQCFLITIIEK